MPPWFFVRVASKGLSSAASLLESTLARARVSVAFNRVRGLQEAYEKWLLEKAGKKSGQPVAGGRRETDRGVRKKRMQVLQFL